MRYVDRAHKEVKGFEWCIFEILVKKCLKIFVKFCKYCPKHTVTFNRLSHLLGDYLRYQLGLWDDLQRLQKGLDALTGEILLSPVFFPGDLAHKRNSEV
jgi:hypothetical protein